MNDPLGVQLYFSSTRYIYNLSSKRGIRQLFVYGDSNTQLAFRTGCKRVHCWQHLTLLLAHQSNNLQHLLVSNSLLRVVNGKNILHYSLYSLFLNSKLQFCKARCTVDVYLVSHY